MISTTYAKNEYIDGLKALLHDKDAQISALTEIIGKLAEAKGLVECDCTPAEWVESRLNDMYSPEDIADLLK